MTRRPPRIDRGTVLGLAMTALSAAVYPAVQDRAGQPLTLFVVGPLLTAVMSTPTAAGVVSVIATIVAGTQGALLGVDRETLGARLGIIVVGSAVGVVAAGSRAHHLRRLGDANLRLTIADTFQGGLVPIPRPAEGTRVDTRYRPGERGLLLGGDFLDVITLPDGATGFVVGDVSGHDARAAAFGTAVRAGWKAVAYSRPEELSSWLDDVEVAFFHDRRYDGFVTAVTGRVDSRDGSVTMVSAGHSWPVEIGAELRVVDMATSPPLGVTTGARRRVTHGRITPGSPWLFYTDGLVENAWTPGGRAGERGLLATLRDMDDPTDLDGLLARMGPRGFQDDVALLLVSR